MSPNFFHSPPISQVGTLEVLETSVHESAHAVVALLARCQVDCISIEALYTQDLAASAFALVRLRSDISIRDRLKIHLAGPVASCFVHRVEVCVFDQAFSGDLQNVIRTMNWQHLPAADLRRDATFRGALEAVIVQVDREWSTITAVAAALERQQVLTGREVRRIIASTHDIASSQRRAINAAPKKYD